MQLFSFIRFIALQLDKSLWNSVANKIRQHVNLLGFHLGTDNKLHDNQSMSARSYIIITVNKPPCQGVFFILVVFFRNKKLLLFPDQPNVFICLLSQLETSKLFLHVSVVTEHYFHYNCAIACIQIIMFSSMFVCLPIVCLFVCHDQNSKLLISSCLLFGSCCIEFG